MVLESAYGLLYKCLESIQIIKYDKYSVFIWRYSTSITKDDELLKASNLQRKIENNLDMNEMLT